MVAQKNFSERLAEIRARSAKLRCEAFVDYSPVVCGLTLNPVTLASYNRLVAFENAFAVGGPISLEAICVWVWVQSPEFWQLAEKAKRRTFAKVCRALTPRFPVTNLFLHMLTVLPRFKRFAWLASPTKQQRADAAVETIRHLMNEALYGFPSPDATRETDEEERELERQEMERETGKPIPKERARFDAAPSVALQAQMLNTFRRVYGMSYSETESIPLKKLGQLWREHLWQSSGDKTGLRFIDKEEAALWAEELETK